MFLVIPYYYKKFEDEINCIMKIKGPFMKIVSLNEAVKHPLFKPNFDIGIFFINFRFFNTHIIQSKKNSMIQLPLKWHHIDKCKKNCRKVDIFDINFGLFELIYTFNKKLSRVIIDVIENYGWEVVRVTIRTI